MRFQIGDDLEEENRLVFQRLRSNPNREVEGFDRLQGIEKVTRLREPLLSYVPKAKTNGSYMLDLGCGDTNCRIVCEHAGFRYVGLDRESDNATILGNAHALPFKQNTFEFILSVAVLEHLSNPFVAMQEAFRVLKQGGRFIGDVAFLEPFHGRSFYHHTHLATANTLTAAGFRIEQIGPIPHWSVFRAQAEMILFPGLPRVLSRALVFPVEILHTLYWRLGYMVTHAEYAEEMNRLLSTSGSFGFVVTKEQG